MNIRNSICSLDSEIRSCDAEIRSCDAESGSAESTSAGIGDTLMLTDSGVWLSVPRRFIRPNLPETGTLNREYPASGSLAPTETCKGSLGDADTRTGDSVSHTASGGV